MILTIYALVVAMGVIACVLGYFTDDEPYLTVGMFIFFMCSIIILTSNLEYETGAAITTTYSYVNGSVTSVETTVENQYTVWNDNMSQKVGWGFGVMSGIGIALSLYNSKKKKMNA